MKFKGFDGREYSFELKYSNRRRTGPCSKYHKRARELLSEIFPASVIIEELSLKGSKTANNNTLAADFFIPSRNLIIEVHGPQHYDFIRHFHKSKYEFFKGCARDKTKIAWCELNDISIVVLKYSDTDEEWRKAIEESE